MKSSYARITEFKWYGHNMKGTTQHAIKRWLTITGIGCLAAYATNTTNDTGDLHSVNTMTAHR
jgi:hypothetical protein